MSTISALKLVVPTSVAGSGVSVSASGKVTMTAATSVSVNGCFTATYDNYLVVMRGVMAAGSPNFYYRMRSAGTDNTTASSYSTQELAVSGTSVSGERVVGITPRIGLFNSTLMNGQHTYFYGPFLAQPTALRGMNANSISDSRMDDFASTHNQSTSYDGFTFIWESSSVTGMLCVYGLSQ